MTIKRCLTIEDKNYDEEFQVFSKNGYFEHDNIIIFDEFEIAQKCLELTSVYNKDDDIYYINKNKLIQCIQTRLNEISAQIIHDVIDIAIDNVNDDEEINWN